MDRGTQYLQFGSHDHVSWPVRVGVHVAFKDVNSGLLRIENENALSEETEIEDGTCACIESRRDESPYQDIARTVLLSPACVLQPLVSSGDMKHVSQQRQSLRARG